MELINVTYYDLARSLFKTSSSDREYVSLFECDCPSCEAHKNNTCIMLNDSVICTCPYGRRRKIFGFTKSAHKCGELINKYKTEHSNLCYALSGVKRIEYIGDEYIFLNLPFLTHEDRYHSSQDSDWEYLKSIYIEIHNKIINGVLIKKEDFTPEFIRRLIDFRPVTLFYNSVISDYYDKYIPKFCYELKKYFPKLFKETAKIKPEIEELSNKVSFIGQKAKLKTLNPGKVKINGHIVDWNGKSIISSTDIIIPFAGLGKSKIIIRPEDNSIVTIIDDNTVKDNTEFV